MYRKREIMKQFSGRGATDTTIPVITLIGGTLINLEEGDTYTEQGATAFDDVDGDITADIVIGGDVVDVNVSGTYTITYDVTDSAGNAAVQVTRDVVVAAVVDTTIPVITLIGASELNLTVFDSFIDAGATAFDAEDGDITGSIVVGGDIVNMAERGVYIITYNVSDAAGNQAVEVTRIVNVTLFPQTVFPTTIDVNDNDWGTFIRPTVAPASYNEPFLDGKTGHTITRVAPVGERTKFHIRYAKDATFNKDDTLMKFNTNNGTAIVPVDDFDARFYRSVPFGGYWSAQDPDLMYGIDTSGGIEFYEFVVSTGIKTVLHDFTGQFVDISIGSAEGNIDRQDRFVALQCEKVAPFLGTPNEIVVLDLQQAKLTPSTPANIWSRVDLPTSNLDWVSMTQSGDYIVVQHFDDGTASNQGTWAYDNTGNNDGLNTGAPTNYRQVTTRASHADLGIDSNGEDVYVGVMNYPDLGIDDYFLHMTRIRDGFEVKKFRDSNSPKGIYGVHVSCRTDRTGWAYITESCCAVNDAGDVYSDGRTATDIFAIRLDYFSNDMQWFCRSYSYNPNVPVYPLVAGDWSAYGVPSNDGTMVAFNSYWNDADLIAAFPNYPPAWLCKVEQ